MPVPILSPERRAEIILAYCGNVDAGSEALGEDAAVRQEDFEQGITEHPCPPLTWRELLALIGKDAL